VHDDVERADALERMEAHGLDAAERAKARLELLGALQRSVREHELARRALEELRQDAARGAPGAEHEHAPALERPAEIAREIAQKADAVGVVAADPAVGFERQRGHRAGLLGVA